MDGASPSPSASPVGSPWRPPRRRRGPGERLARWPRREVDPLPPVCAPLVQCLPNKVPRLPPTSLDTQLHGPMLVGLKLVAAQPPRQMAKQLVRPLPVAQNPQCDQSLPHFASRLRRWSRRPRPMEVGVHHSWSRLGTRQSGNGPSPRDPYEPSVEKAPPRRRFHSPGFRHRIPPVASVTRAKARPARSLRSLSRAAVRARQAALPARWWSAILGRGAWPSAAPLGSRQHGSTACSPCARGSSGRAAARPASRGPLGRPGCGRRASRRRC